MSFKKALFFQNTESDTESDLSSDDEENFENKRELQNFSTEWILMLDETNDTQEMMINSLLDIKVYPSREQLSVILERLGKNNSKFKRIIDAICEYTKSLSMNILEVTACYKLEDLTEVVFLVIYDGEFDSDVQEKLKQFNTYCRIKNVVSKERKDVLLHKVNIEETLAKDVEEKLKQTIASVSNALCQKHSNITIISPSNIKSVGFDSGEHKMSNTPCIVLCVPVKGLIPLFEEPFPLKIGQSKFPTDVMEGTFSYFGQNAKEKNSKLKTGCQVTCRHYSDNSFNIGTIGPFIQLNNNNIGFITSAHVVCNVQSLNFIEGIANIPDLSLPVYQPDPTYADNLIGFVRQIYAQDGRHKDSLEVAVVEIETRKPDSGTFPDDYEKCFFYRNRRTKKGFHSCETSYSGKCCTESDEVERGTMVYTFGSQSGAKKGFISQKENFCNKNGFKMLNQIEVFDATKCDSFAQHGDSGSTVFVKKCNGDMYILGILHGGEPGIYYVTPIWSINNALKCHPHIFNV